MVYLMGIMGFIGGFIFGQMMIYFLLRHKTPEQIMHDKSLRVYGLINWLIAALGSYAFVIMYNQYYGP